MSGSDLVFVVLFFKMAVPGQPSTVYFPQVNDTSLIVVWNVPLWPNGIITGYRLAYALATTTPGVDNPEVVDESLPAEAREYAVGDLVNRKSYVFSVAAKSTLGWGEAARAEVLVVSNRSKCLFLIAVCVTTSFQIADGFTIVLKLVV